MDEEDVAPTGALSGHSGFVPAVAPRGERGLDEQALSTALARTRFPATKADVVASLRGATPDLERLPDRQFANAADVRDALRRIRSRE